VLAAVGGVLAAEERGLPPGMTPGRSVPRTGDVEWLRWLGACCGPMIAADDGLTSR